MCGESPHVEAPGCFSKADEIVCSAWRHAASRKDGDLVMLTDNRVLIERHEKLPAIMCIQRRAPKKIVEDSDLMEANIASFGDDIGKITNRVTTMYDVQAKYSPDSKEYKELDYRIITGQNFQQNAMNVRGSVR